MIEPERLLGMEFLGNTVLSWLFAAAAFFVTFTVLPLVRGYLSAMRKRKPVHEHMAIDLALVLASRTTRLFLLAVAIWVGSLPLQLPDRVEKIENGAMLVVLWIQIGLWAVAAVRFFLDRRRGVQADKGLAGSFDIILFVLRLVIWTLVLLFALDNLGVEVTALIAGLGIGGIAVALAVQNVLGDLFASLSITLDKPFVVGDFLVIDKDMGTVERIGVKSTRLRSLDGEQIIVSNADLLKSRLHNFGRMYERRVAFTVSVRYETPLETMKEIPQLLAGIVREQQKVRFDRSHFARYGDFALLFEVVYVVLSPDFNLYMDIQQAINLRIFEEFGKRNIVFSYRERQPAPLRGDKE
ncbi:MAG TPA: mechanosensitive ion channel family protein [Steroidobacteraceae bacterium]|nr:mechanosensitive ion channel family protein [Steroidobacteraceae bacterium]